MRNLSSKKWSFLAVLMVSAIANLGGIPLVIAQTNPPPSAAQSAELQEAERLNQQALQLYNEGKYSEAIPLVQRAIAIGEKVLEREHPAVATSLNNLAQLYQAQGNYTQAEPLYQRSLAIYEKALGREHPDVAESLNNLAVLYQAQGNYTQAEPLIQRSLAIYEKVLGREHPDVATSLNRLALIYHNQGNDSQAEPLIQRSLAIYEKALGRKHPDVATSLNSLAVLYQAQGNYTQAEPLYQRSLAIYEKALGREHPGVATSLNNLAGLYQAQNDIPRAIEFLNRGSNIEEHNLALILTTGSEPQKRAYIATLSSSTNVTISLHLQGSPNNPQSARLALTTILRRKGRVLDALTDSLQALKSRLNPEDKVLLDKLAMARSQLAALTFKGAGNTPLEQFGNQITTLSEQEQTIEAAISRRSAEFRTQNQPVTIEGVQKLIPADAALVEIVLYYPFNPKAKYSDRFGNPRYVAYILQSQGEPKSVELGNAATINKAVTEFRRTIRSKGGSQMPFRKAARTLDTMLMQPIRNQLGNKRNILLSPDSQLNLIPFAALIDEKNQYLLENYEITYLSSGRDLIKLQLDLPSKENPVIVANPLFDKPGNPATVRVASNNTRGIGNQTSKDLASLQYDSIEGTATEAKAISTILPNVKLLTGSDATENATKQLNAPNILHIATHGFFLSDAPPVQPSSGETTAPSNSSNPLLRSGLALAGFNLRKSGNEDGVLTALEVAGLNLAGTKLVVLSACETGIGDVANGEGVYGLRRALAIAGAESQLITLWLVDDFATKDLMMKYYQRLQKNVGRSAALRQVQLEMLKNPQYQRPYYWAAFIPSGEWASLKVKP